MIEYKTENSISHGREKKNENTTSHNKRNHKCRWLFLSILYKIAKNIQMTFYPFCFQKCNRISLNGNERYVSGQHVIPLKFVNYCTLATFFLFMLVVAIAVCTIQFQTMMHTECLWRFLKNQQHFRRINNVQIYRILMCGY